MASVRKNHTTEFKAKVAIEAIRQQKATNELTAEYSVHATPPQSVEETGIGGNSRGILGQTGESTGKPTTGYR